MNLGRKEDEMSFSCVYMGGAPSLSGAGKTKLDVNASGIVTGFGVIASDEIVKWDVTGLEMPQKKMRKGLLLLGLIPALLFKKSVYSVDAHVSLKSSHTAVFHFDDYTAGQIRNAFAQLVIVTA